MNKNLIWLSVILVPAITLAPISRFYKTENYASSDEVADREIQIKGLKKRNSFQSLNTGPYQIQLFSPNFCDGSIFLLPVYRNAEGAHILRHFIEEEFLPPQLSFADTNLKEGIIFQQKIYQDLPQWKFTLNQVSNKFKQLLIAKYQPVPPFVFAEKGDCNIAQHLTKDAVISFSN